MSIPSITRRGFTALSGAGLTAAMLRAGSSPANAASETFVSGWGLPSNLDPHQIFDGSGAEVRCVHAP